MSKICLVDTALIINITFPSRTHTSSCTCNWNYFRNHFTIFNRVEALLILSKGLHVNIASQTSHCHSTLCTHLTHWGRVTHIYVSELTIIGSDNGLAPDRRQAIIWTNAGILLIGPLGTNISEISIEIDTFSFKKIHLKMSSGKWRPFCLGLNVLKVVVHVLWWIQEN